MSSIYGFTITTAGRSLLAKLLAGQTLEITRTMVGTGKVPEGTNPATFADLVSPLAQATATIPTVSDMTATFSVEYRSDLNGGLDAGKYINEFGVFARDPSEGEILLYYGTLGDFPQYVPPYSPQSIGILRYPVAISLMADDIEVILAFDASAFMTSQDIAEYIQTTTMPDVTKATQELVNSHNAAEDTHHDIRNLTAQIAARVGRMEDMMLNDVTGNPFIIDFANLNGLIVEGVWNKTLQRIEF